jgi:hypothetical protein
MKKKQQRKSRKRPSTRVALQRSAERRALQLALITDRLRQRALRGEEIDLRALVALETAAADAAAKLVEAKELKVPTRPTDDRIEVVLVRPGDPGSGSPNNAPPAASSTSTGGSGYWPPTPTADELRRIEQQGEIDVAVDELRRAQIEMQERLRKQPDAPRPGGPNSWLKH